jgi:hypothetical protein
VGIRSIVPCVAPSIVVLACIGIGLNGCSSSSDPSAVRGRDPGSSATPGASPGGSGPGSTNAGHDGRVDNPGSVLTPPPTGAAGADATQMPTPMTPNTSISREPIAIDDCGADNTAGLSAADVQTLKAGGSPGALRMLYPYEGTVFPRGMLAPDLMWDGAAADAVYLHIKSGIFEYWGCLKPLEPGRITLPQEVWDQAGQRSLGRDDVYVIELSVLAQGAVVGPALLNVQIAQAAIKGSIYYNTYASQLVMPTAGADPAAGFPFPGGLGGAAGGIVVRIPAGGRAEVFGQTDCNGCHSVSADGSLLLAQSVAAGAYSYDLVANGPAPVPAMPGTVGCWSALYPDGSAYLSMSSVIDVARAALFGMSGGAPPDATLFDSLTGMQIPSSGIPPGALMPFFSPDGTFLVFNDYAIAEAHGIALTRYDTAAHSASEYTMLYTEPPGAMRPGWPFFLPDNHGVLFVRTDQVDFTGGGVGVSGAIQPGTVAPFSELSIIDIDSKTVTVLAKAMGYNTPEDAANGVSYLPFGEEDLHHAYYPTVSPVGGGGYFWVFFDSIRHYGNLGLQRQLWGAAIDISADGTYSRDPSHPAFYVSGQEPGAGNHRAFAALDPCRQDGDACTSGVDCCGGFCFIEDPQELVESVGKCSPTMMTCAKRDERCTSSSDCCLPTDPSELPNTCIAGFCTVVSGPD